MPAPIVGVQAQIEFLKASHILHITTAARSAGLKFRSGEYSKAALIERLSQNTMILGATVAVIQRLRESDARSGRDTGSNGLLDDIEESSSQETPRENQSAPIPSADLDEIRASITAVKRAVETLSGKTEFSLGKLSQAMESLSARVAALEQRKPVVFQMGEQKKLEVSGGHYLMPKLFALLTCRNTDPEKGPIFRTHVTLMGPASSGKTTAAKIVAEKLGLPLYSQPLSLTSVDVLGFILPNGDRLETEFTRAWLGGGIFLWDELSMSQPDAVGALNSALANGFVAIPGIGNVAAHPDFYCMVGDNSDTGASQKYSARNLPDGATLDRFMNIDWPIDTNLEDSLCAYPDWTRAVRAIRAYIESRDDQHVGATMRATIGGNALLNQGILSHMDILEFTCKKGILRGSWPDVLRLPEVQAFLRG